MNQTHVAGGPLGVARVDRPRRRPRRPRSPNAASTVKLVLTGIGSVVRVLAGAAIVGAAAISSLGLVGGSVVAAAALVGLTVLSLRHRPARRT